MAAIGRFQKGDEVFYAKVVDGEIFRVQGDVFGSPSFERKPMKIKGVRTLTPVVPSKVIAVGLNYADHAREHNKPLPKEPLFWIPTMRMLTTALAMCYTSRGMTQEPKRRIGMPLGHSPISRRHS